MGIPSDKRDDTAPVARAGAGWILFALVFVVPGVLTVAQALGLGEFVGRSLVPNWVLGFAGLMFLLPGIYLLATFCGLPTKSLAGLVGNAVFLSIAAVFNYAVFVGDLRGWSGSSIAALGLSAGHVTRILVAGFDLLMLVFLAVWAAGFASAQRSSLLARLDALPADMRKLVGWCVLGGPFALAAILHYTGALDWVGATLGQNRTAAGARSAYEHYAQPLERWVGWWDGAPGAQPGWTSRIIVRAEGNNAWMRIWKSCPPNHCEEGEFKAKLLGAPPARVHGLEVVRVIDGVTVRVTLRPNGGLTSSLLRDEDHLRGRDWNTHQQWINVFKRTR